jgi:hypothetical protein
MRGAGWAAAVLVVAACGPPNPCSGHQFDRLRRYSLPYAGHWRVAHGDTLTFPDAPAMSDRFRLSDITLDTATIVIDRECIFRGQIVFSAPRAETLAVNWFGQPDRRSSAAGPPTGPFAGDVARAGGTGLAVRRHLMDSKGSRPVPE